MTRLVFLSPAQKRTFDSPPVFNKSQRPAYFVVTDDIRKTMSSLRSATNKAGFLLQLGYFKHSGKFFEKSTFRQRDIKYVKQLLEITEAVNFHEYSASRMAQHRSRILALLDWSAFDADNTVKIAEHVQIQAQQQPKPEQVFAAAVDFCWKQRIEIPTHHQLANVITDSFNIVESTWLTRLQSALQPDACEALDTLLNSPTGLPSLLGDIKK